ncbi:MAG: DUF5615 family PIN-like protein [Chloroflexota bacterium]|nr:MAG: hypothetical protein DLM70_19780 [Chloroflexota bacterium]
MPEFYIDNNVALEVAGFLRAAGHPAVTARDLHRETNSDDEQLLVASQHGHVFLTHNETDFILLHDAWQRWSAAWGVTAHHAGILIVPQGRRYGVDWEPEEVSEAVIACLQQCPPVAGHLFRRKEAEWERREGRDWIPCG